MPPIVLRWTPTQADLADAHAARGPRPPMNPILRFGAALAFLLAGTCFLLVDRYDVALACATAAAVLAVLPTIAARTATGRKRPSGRVFATKGAYAPLEAVLGADGLVVVGTSTTTLPWSAFTRSVETERSFVLLGPRGKARLPLLTYLPKRAAPDVAGLRALLAEAVRPR